MTWLSPSELLEAVAENLRDEIAPQVEDPFRESQVYSTYSILINLSNRVRTREDWIREVNEHLRETLADLPDERLPESLRERRERLLGREFPDETARNRQLNALIERLIARCWEEKSKHPDPDPFHESLREALRFQLDRELTLTR